MRADTVDAIRRRIDATRRARMEARDLARSGFSDLAEDDTTRRLAFAARVAKTTGTPEAVRDSNDFQPVAFLTIGARVRRSVARVLTQPPGESRSGSGFLISPDLFITNQHVVSNSEDALQTNLYFDDELDLAGRSAARTVFRLAPERFALFSDEHELDYALVALGERVEGSGTVEDFGYIPLGFSPDRHRKGMNVNIIQHPNGSPKTIAVRNNLLVERTDDRLLYETDTDVGSSGSPVANDEWDVVALHHYGDVDGQLGNPLTEESGKVVNEGIRISAIFEDLQKRLATLEPIAREMLERALKLWTDATPTGKRLEHRPPVRATHSEVANETIDSLDQEKSMTSSMKEQATLVVPLEVSIRVGSIPLIGVGATASADTSLMLPEQRAVDLPSKMLSASRERSKLDADYANRNGYDASFVPDMTLSLSSITKPRKSDIAKLKAGQRKDGRLDYQNFSVVMHGSRGLALLTATNIDGPSYVAIDRKTGERAEKQPEGETWYRDSRIDEALTVGLDFYAGWSHLFDRGHLTRRNDPTWGEQAERANVDTFHLTNCTPQHWKFNESSTYWQGIERYVLEKGLFAAHLKGRLTVLQGPLFNDEDDLWADEVQIPAAFWKIVVWNGKNGLSAVAMLADQSRLLSVVRSGGVMPASNDSAISVGQFQISIASVSKKTGLDFSALEPFDTFGQGLPKASEKLQMITRWDDVKLD